MLFRRHIAKRVIAVLGIALTAFGCMQDVRAICGLLGCVKTRGLASLDCCQCNPGGVLPSAEQAAVSTLVTARRADGANCPSQHCPPNCWCRQASSPGQAPSPVVSDSFGQPSDGSYVSRCVAPLVDAARTGEARTICEASPRSAAAACALLCRFLS